MAKVVVFGAAGQVGVSLVETALRDGYQVTAFIRNTPLPGHLADKVWYEIFLLLCLPLATIGKLSPVSYTHLTLPTILRV